MKDHLTDSKTYYSSLNDTLVKSLGEADDLHQSSPLAYCETALDVLAATILTQATSDRNALKSWHQLKKTFPEWESVLEADENKLVEAIRSGGLANQKAKAIRAVLKEIQNRYQKLSLESLGQDPKSAWRELLSLPGVGPKTAACTLLFGYKLPMFPVDTHIHRIALRNDWVKSGTNPGQTQEILSPIIPAEYHASLHILLLNLGRLYCRPHNPNCQECPLRQRCKQLT